MWNLAELRNTQNSCYQGLGGGVAGNWEMLVKDYKLAVER